MSPIGLQWSNNSACNCGNDQIRTDVMLSLHLSCSITQGRIQIREEKCPFWDLIQLSKCDLKHQHPQPGYVPLTYVALAESDVTEDLPCRIMFLPGHFRHQHRISVLLNLQPLHPLGRSYCLSSWYDRFYSFSPSSGEVLLFVHLV